MKILRSTSIAFLLTLPLASVATAQEVPEPLFTVEGITEYRLENGLRVLLFPDASKKTFTVNVTYMVGSRHEGRGEKGMAHLLEHMVFKGTDTYENIWGALEDHGANFNGTTWLDRTNYFETLPTSDENLEFALSMEADRMVNSRIAAEDLATEMTVVRNEFEMGENDPVGILMERILSSAYLWHNYGFSTIGNRSDIERVPVENLRRFYERFYQPDNAMLVVAGNFDEQATLGLIQKHFGAIPRPERELSSTWTEEPAQDGARFVSLRRVGSSQAAGAAYHIPAGSHSDAPAIELLADILSSEPSGRIYEALVPTGLATGVSAFMFPTREPGLLLVMAQSREDQDVQTAHDTMLGVAEGLGSEGLTEEEVERAKNRALKNIKLALNSSGRIGVQLSEWQAMGDWRLFFVHRDRLADVTVADVERVAQRYLMESNRTSGIFAPDAEPRRAEVPPTPDVVAMVEGYEGGAAIAVGEAFEPTPANIEARTRRTELRPGMRAAFLSKETRGDQVVAQLVLHYGRATDLVGHPTALEMLPAILMRGTQRLDFQALKDEIDRLQSRISVSGDAGEIRGSIVTDRENLLASIALLGEILRQPAFPEEEFGLLKEELLAELESGLTDPMPLAFNRLDRAFAPYPRDSVFYVPTLEETIELTQAVTLENLKELYGRFYGAGAVEISVVGDFDEEATAKALLAALGDWESPAPYEPLVRPFVAIEASNEAIDTPDKQMAVVAIGTTMPLRDDDPHYAAIDFANYILGESAKSRLLNRLRHQGGLSYGAGSRFQVDDQDESAVIAGFAICAPQNALKAQGAMREEFVRWIEAGVTEEELGEGKQSYSLKFEGQLAEDGFVARQLVDDLEVDRTFEFHAERMRSVNELTLEEISATLQERLGEAALFELRAGDLEKAEAPE